MTDTIPSKTVVMDVFLLFVEFCPDLDELVIVPVDELVGIVPDGGILLYFYFFILA